LLGLAWLNSSPYFVPFRQGNEIIKKLQDDLRGYMSKVKLKNEVTTRQEHVISEKEKLNEKLKKELDENTRNLKVCAFASKAAVARPGPLAAVGITHS